MKYPDGTVVNLSDRVWFNNEDAVGVVVDIWETAEQWKAMGVDEPGMATCGEGSNSDLSDCSFVAYPKRSLKDDDIRFLLRNAEKNTEISTFEPIKGGRTECSWKTGWLRCL